ncbi:right-handed parallel beta-helix repeat-containing protein [uncultured Prevotella sp.]|uniref:right-handed parallel beta-helix repeat-containing protein n=1 Tax=uncultured Prevotella sp. TaxID=159272 RepID=UPI00258B8529|nr:right-handed parallel beta-helix repeat-containing protein [uncultured Prevotella sp.]
MRQKRLLLLLVLLLTATTGAWAQDAKHLIKATYDKQTRSLEQPLPYATTIGELYEAVTGEPFSDLLSRWSALEMPLTGISSNNTDVVSIGDFNGASTPVTVKADGEATVSLSFSGYYQGIYVNVVPPLYAYVKDGTKDADKWTVKVGEGQAQALPIGGLKGGETVTLQYTGRLKVKGVTATSDEKPAAPSFTEVTTFSELQTALSAGKDVKLKNDIVCTSETEININGALTIDGNGKTLSTTSAIRAFMVEFSATVAFKDLTLTGFVSGGGPAINNSGTIVLDGCTISNCHVNNSNGGGAIESSGKLYAINTTFSGNYSGEIGGAINNYGGSLYMSGCTFTNNYTTRSDAYYGGAIGINRGSEIRLINCAFSGNKYGTTTGPSDIGVYSKPTNYTIAGCTGATIASDDGDITPNTSGTATLDYSDLSNIAFTVEPSAPAGSGSDIPNSDPYTPGGDPFSF